MMLPHGGLAQLGERYAGSVEVTGSIPVSSTVSESPARAGLSRSRAQPAGRATMKHETPVQRRSGTFSMCFTALRYTGMAFDGIHG